jgi:hypothetical protein
MRAAETTQGSAFIAGSWQGLRCVESGGGRDIQHSASSFHYNSASPMTNRFLRL